MAYPASHPCSGLLGALQEFRPWNEDDMSASAALHAHIAPQLHDFPFLAAAGVLLLHLDDVSDAKLNKLHKAHPF